MPDKKGIDNGLLISKLIVYIYVALMSFSLILAIISIVIFSNN
ncbi:hypothetical protein AEQU2_01812 [Aequorivita lipolytica]|nr:hypothetical protein AEQU2_01812 [Aequorivita lipolytica]